MSKIKKKIRFPMLNAKNQFHILVLHFKKHVIKKKKKTPFLMYFYCTIYQV